MKNIRDKQVVYVNTEARFFQNSYFSEPSSQANPPTETNQTMFLFCCIHNKI